MGCLDILCCGLCTKKKSQSVSYSSGDSKKAARSAWGTKEKVPRWKANPDANDLKYMMTNAIRSPTPSVASSHRSAKQQQPTQGVKTTMPKHMSFEEAADIPLPSSRSSSTSRHSRSGRAAGSEAGRMAEPPLPPWPQQDAAGHGSAKSEKKRRRGEKVTAHIDKLEKRGGDLPTMFRSSSKYPRRRDGSTTPPGSTVSWVDDQWKDGPVKNSIYSRKRAVELSGGEKHTERVFSGPEVRRKRRSDI